MGTYRIKPDGNGWVVSKNGRTLSNHRKKSGAKRSANRKANSGDTVVEHGRNGRIQNQRTKQ